MEKLYEELMNPPYGVRIGPIPILLCAAILHYRTEIALYENGSFVADMSVPVFERLLKAPKKFEIKRFRMAGIRIDLFARSLKLLNQPAESENPDLLTIVTPLIRFIVQLPIYTQKTQRINDEAKKLREVVNKAGEPDELLFKQLPESLGYSEFTAESTDDNVLSDFFQTLQTALSELSGAYNELLNFIERMLAEAFTLESSGEELRFELNKRAKPLLEFVIEAELKGFIIHLYNEGHDFPSWIESIGTFIVKKPPASWTDTDITQFEINLSQIVRKFNHFETVSFEKLPYRKIEGEIIRIGITSPNEQEQEQVVNLPTSAEDTVNKFDQKITELFEELDIDQNQICASLYWQESQKKYMQGTK